MYTDEQKDTIVRMWNEGASREKIGAAIGVDKYAIEYALSRMRKGVWGEEYKDKLPTRKCDWSKVNAARKNKPKKESKPQANTLDDDIRKAHMLGMSYGKYIQMKEGR